MVLDHERGARDAYGLAQEHHRIVDMVQDVHEEHDVHLLVAEGQAPPVEELHRNVAHRACERVDRAPGEIWPPREHQAREQPVAAAHVQHRGMGGNERVQVPREHAHAPRMDARLVDCPDERHLRSMPSILMRKLDMMVWKPSAESVTPGTTQRMVSE